MTLYTYFVIVAAVLYTLSLIAFTPAHWWTSWTGRVLWGTIFTKTVAVVLILSSFTLGDYALREVFRYVAYTLVLINSILVFTAITNALNIGRKKGSNVRTELDAISRTRDSADQD